MKYLKFFFLFFSFGLFSNSLNAQIKAAGFHIIDLPENICDRIITRSLGSTKANAIIAEILNVVKLKWNGRILECPDFGGKLVTFVENGTPWIVYDSELFSEASEFNSWAIKGMFAHELSHHLMYHTSYDPTNYRLMRREELDADEWAGYILRKLGANKKESLLFLDLAEHPSCEIEEFSTHPCRKQRDEAVLKGWTEAKK